MTNNYNDYCKSWDWYTPTTTTPLLPQSYPTYPDWNFLPATNTPNPLLPQSYPTYPDWNFLPATNTPNPPLYPQIPSIVIYTACNECGKWLDKLEHFFVRKGLGFCSRKCLKQFKIREVEVALDR